MKKLLFSGVFSCLFLFFTMAQKTVSLESVSLIKYSDTTTESNQSAIATATIVTTKKGFKDLFEGDLTTGPRLNPRAISFVSDYMEKNTKDLSEMKGWGKPYFNLMDGILQSYNLPKELKYLAVIESELHRGAVSRVGAVGPWQLMPGTARLLGLKVNKHVDERTNYLKSTHAAARYLTDLYTQFGDWLLVIAAYNGGPGNVLKAIKKSGSRNFWNLQYYLPAESRMHVKKFIGTHYIFEGQGGLTTLTKEETDKQYAEFGLYDFNRRLTTDEVSACKSQNVSGKYHSAIIASYVTMDIKDFNRYNPDFDKVMASANNTYELKLPADKMEAFNAGKYQILNESIQLMLNTAVTVSEPQVVKDSTLNNKTAKK
jgi:membrane-bound lytic murein transglycosylase D